MFNRYQSDIFAAWRVIRRFIADAVFIPRVAAYFVQPIRNRARNRHQNQYWNGQRVLPGDISSGCWSRSSVWIWVTKNNKGCRIGGHPWWCHQMKTLSALLALCEGNPPVTGGFPSQRPVTRSFDVFFDLRLNKRLSKQSRCQWFGTASFSLWRHYNVLALLTWCHIFKSGHCNPNELNGLDHMTWLQGR